MRRPTSASLWFVLTVLTFSLSTFTHAQIYLGCYAVGSTPAATTLSPGGDILQESNPSSIQSLQNLSSPFEDIYMSRGLCTEHCKSLQLMYAVLERGSLCFCFSESPREQSKVDDVHCDKPCAGYTIETCGSGSRPGGLEKKEDGSVYGSVLLVGNSLSGVPVSEQPVQGQNSSNQLEGSSAPPGEGGVVGSVAVGTASVQESQGQDGNREQAGTVVKDEKRHSHEEIEDEEEDDPEEEEDIEEEEEEKDEEPDRAGKAPAVGHDAALALTGIPVASTVVGAVCLLGICAFFIYLTRKRQRERVRAAWVESVFGLHHGQSGDDPRRLYSNGYIRYGTSHDNGSRRNTAYNNHNSNNHNNRHSAAERKVKKQQKQPQRPALEDLESVSDIQSEDTLDYRRQSTHHVPSTGVQQRSSQIMEVGGGGGGDVSYSRAVRSTVMLPAAAAGRSGRVNYKGNNVPSPLPSPMEYASHPYGGGSGVHTHSGNGGGETLYATEQQPYEEFFDQDECEVDAEIAHLPDEYAVLQHQPMQSVVSTPQPVQRPAYVAYSNNPYSHYRYAQHLQHLQPHQHQLQQQQQHHQQHQQQQQQQQRRRSHVPPLSEMSIHPMQHDQASAYSLNNPFRDTFPQHSSLLVQPQHLPQRHSLDSSTGRLFSPTTSTFEHGSTNSRPKRPALSEYRRPHSFTLGENHNSSSISNNNHLGHQDLGGRRSGPLGGMGTDVGIGVGLGSGSGSGGGGEVGTEGTGYRIALHVLDEEHDLFSVTDSEPAVESVTATAMSTTARATATATAALRESNRRSTFSGSLRQKLKRLSSPYVQAIRHQQQQHQQQQQQRLASGGSLSCGDEGGGCGGVESSSGCGNGFETIVPAPGQAPASEQRRWSRVLLKNGHASHQHHHHHPYRHGRVSYEEDFGEQEGARAGAATTTTTWKHRQVHSGSLASFRGLDDPSLPRLRVMNPDDGIA
ncbi:hypothetical protein BGZ72_010880 [Mortierella alpina]|nr:hypothetical protein BGZ72_010880 [Mortierella alpina]